MTSDYHADNVGKVVFSTSEIKFRNENPDQIGQEFRLAEPLWGRVYMSRSLRNQDWVLADQKITLSSPETAYTIKMWIDEVHQAYRFGEFLHHQDMSYKSASEWTTFQVNLNPTDRSKSDRYTREAWSKLTAKLSPGPHKVFVEIWGQQGKATTTKPVATGGFTVIVGEGDIAGASHFPKDSYTGSDAASIKQAMRSAMLGKGVASKAEEIRDISITSDWREGIYTDSKNRYRKIQGTVLWRDSDGDGLSRFTSYSFIQDWTGSAWSKLRFKAFVNGGPEGEAKAR